MKKETLDNIITIQFYVSVIQTLLLAVIMFKI